MFKRKGTAASSGIALGMVFLYKKAYVKIDKDSKLEPVAELQRFNNAKQEAAKQLTKLFEKTRLEIGEDEAMIIDVQIMMLDDADYTETIIEVLENDRVTAEFAVHSAGERFAEFFASMEDDYMKARAVDVRDISARLVRIIQNAENDDDELKEPSIIVAEDLTPTETVKLDKDKILGFVTQKGSVNSHTAILARMLGVPTIIGADLELNNDINHKQIIIDGFSGDYIIEPDNETLSYYRKKQKEILEKNHELDSLKGLESVTKGGRKVHIYANIGSERDLDSVIKNDAEGVGLFRSEFLYLGRDSYPNEEEQFRAYKAVVEGMNSKRVIIRTLDIGADKQVDYFELPKEENPAMGYRAIRICLDRLEIFKTQLRALFRASAFGKVGIMFPMIISVEEVLKIKSVVDEVKADLTRDGISFGDAELGIMIETPAAVMISDDLAKYVDFFSVGTNDLTQYTLAIDRQNCLLDSIYDSHHKALLRMLELVADNAVKNGIWAGICGELAADTSLTEAFVNMGYTELSVSPVFVLELRKKLRSLD